MTTTVFGSALPPRSTDSALSLLTCASRSRVMHSAIFRERSAWTLLQMLFDTCRGLHLNSLRASRTPVEAVSMSLAYIWPLCMHSNQSRDVISNPRSQRLRMLCATALRELAPSTSLHIDGFGPPIDREQLPTVLMLLLGDNMHFANTPALLPDVVEWLVGTVSLSDLISSHRAPSMASRDHVQSCRGMSRWGDAAVGQHGMCTWCTQI